MNDVELQRRKEERRVRVMARIAELARLQNHPQQQHAMCLLLARGHRLAAQSDATNRDWWIAGARRCLEQARAIR